VNRGEEQVLVKRAAAGDRAAAEGLIRAHQQSLFAYLVRMSGRPEVAEDIVQEAFVRVLQHLDRFDPKFRFSTWLFTIARRLLVNQAQRCKPAYDTDGVGRRESRWDSPETSASAGEASQGARAAIQRALLELNETQREVVILFHQLDWPIWLIAQHMGMPEGTVKSHLHRGRRRMKEVLQSAPKLVGEAVA
jgi:RNA polymerase sigma-70 factor (ECF subfamily)